MTEIPHSQLSQPAVEDLVLHQLDSCLLVGQVASIQHPAGQQRSAISRHVHAHEHNMARLYLNTGSLRLPRARIEHWRKDSLAGHLQDMQRLKFKC